MKRTRKQQELEKKLILEEYDSKTLEDRAEDEQLLSDTLDEIETDQKFAFDIVKKAYGKITNGHAIIRTQFSLFVLFGVILFGIGSPTFLITMYIVKKWWLESGMLFCVLVFSTGSIGAAIGMYWVFLRTAKKLFDIYYFQQGRKRIIIYQNYKYTIYYRNRKEFVCIENKTKKWIKDYGRDDFMNLRLGFNSLVGDLKYQKLKGGGYGIWTPARYSTATQMHIFSGYATLKVDDEFNPIRLFIDGGRHTSYIYDFKNGTNFKVTLPKEILYACDTLKISPPNENQWLTFK